MIHDIHRRRIILGSHAPGLGDWLIYTVLAKHFFSLGHYVYISTLPCPNHHVAFRHDETRQLLWEMNPWIRGFVDEPPTVPNLFQDLRYIKLAKQIGVIPAVERLYGFEPSGQKVPVVFYEPKFLPELANVTVADPTSISQPMSGEVFVDYMAWADRWHDLGPNYLILVPKPEVNSMPFPPPKNFPIYTPKDIFEYCDILASAKATLMTEAGGHVLSAALRKTGTFSCTTTMAFNDRIFVFPEDIVKYYITGRLTLDFHYYPPGEVIV